MIASRRILFLALSGVRVCDPELRKQGLTLPGFVERGRTIAEMPALGLLTLAGLCPEHWHAEYRELDAPLAPWGDFAAGIAEEQFDLVAISALTARINEAYALADELKGCGVKVVLGGLHISALPDEAAQHADAIVVGEGEGPWTALLNDIEVGFLRPRYIASEHQVAFDYSPVPRYDLLRSQRYNRIPLQTQRGCPWHCEFCGASRTISAFKCKSADHIRRDLDAALSAVERPFIELADDNTFADKKHGRSVVECMSSRNLHWFTETDITVAKDEQLLDALSGSGCVELLIGFESSQPRSLSGLDTHDFKLRSLDWQREAVQRIQSRGIGVNGCFIIGLDGDDENVFERTYNYVCELELAEVQITLPTPFPGTAFHRRLQREGRLLRQPYWEQCTLFDVTFNPAKMSVDTLRTGFAWLMERLYNGEAAQRRKRLRSKLTRARLGEKRGFATN
ncbi:MAG: cobalamin-dependent protein [Planctomycetes bacterium]|nr:cobalamin-dependent protein [Planctomycetota bacterium]NUQ34146.1 cobalamin B12-binding domain-containing protein [Planctomycetaceae bacterium]